MNEKVEDRVFYKMTKEDEKFIEDAAKAGVPISFADVMTWIIVAKEFKCGLQEANEILGVTFKQFIDIAKKVTTGIQVVGSMGKGKIQ